MNDHDQHPDTHNDSLPLNVAIVLSALKSNNPKLHQLVESYLLALGTEDSFHLLEMLWSNATPDTSYEQFEDVHLDNYNSSESQVSNQYWLQKTYNYVGGEGSIVSYSWLIVNIYTLLLHHAMSTVLIELPLFCHF